MPKRLDTGVAVSPDGTQTGYIYSPKAALHFIRTILKRNIGESTIRLWRSKSKGPAFHRDGDGQIWYHEDDLRDFFAQRPVTEDGRSNSSQQIQTVAADALTMIGGERPRRKLRLPVHSSQNAA